MEQTEKQLSKNTTQKTTRTTQNRGFLQKGKLFLLHQWRTLCYFCQTLSRRKWIKKEQAVITTTLLEHVWGNFWYIYSVTVEHVWGHFWYRYSVTINHVMLVTSINWKWSLQHNDLDIWVQIQVACVSYLINLHFDCCRLHSPSTGFCN